MAMLHPTPPHRLVDEEGRPYFLWDMDVTLDAFRERLRTGDPDTRAWLLGKLLREAKPDDVFEFTTLAEIRVLWPRLERHLGRTREFWTWLMQVWEVPLGA